MAFPFPPEKHRHLHGKQALSQKFFSKREPMAQENHSHPEDALLQARRNVISLRKAFVWLSGSKNEFAS
jgi:hypothetical protein